MNSIEIHDIAGTPIKYLYQWDSNQRIRIAGIDVDYVTEVHFCHTDSVDALVVQPVVRDTDIVVDVPNILLQQPKPIVLHIFQDSDTFGQRTIQSKRIGIFPRAKPADYVYTETEILSYRILDARLKVLEDSYDCIVDQEDVCATSMVTLVGNGANWTADKSLQQLLALLESGAMLWCCVERGATVDVLPVVSHCDDRVMFGCMRGDSSLSAVILDNTVVVNEKKLALRDNVTNIGAQIYNLTQEIGELAKLRTADKSSLVAAINEVLRSGGGTVDEDAIARLVEEYLAENPPVVTETDPTVPDWAKRPEKPVYTADEVGALRQGELQTGINLALEQAKTSGAFNGKDGEDGKGGADGKSAYQYAQDAGYAGTEAEFAQKLAADVKSGGDEWELISEKITIEKEVASVHFSKDADGKAFSLKKMRIFMYLPPETDGTAYADYRVSGCGTYTSPSGGWSNTNLMCDIETMGDGNTANIVWFKLGQTWETATSRRVQYVWRAAQLNTITSFTWALFSRNVMPGTTFEIWGVRA